MIKQFMISSDPSKIDQTGPADSTPSWLGVAAMLADLAFEADCAGRFTGFGPGKVVGRPASSLLGSAATALIEIALPPSLEQGGLGLDTVIASICRECVSWRGHVRLAGQPGGLFLLSLAPRITSFGHVAGIYGLLCALERPADSGHATAAAALESSGAAPRTDMLDADTGLWSARIFADEIGRRLDRLDVEELPGTLLLLGFCRAPEKRHNLIARRIAEELREIVRPTDLLGRIDGSTLALWCDGMDHLTGAERAARFCAQLPSLLPDRTRISAGLAPRWPGSADDPATIIGRAGVALRLADLATERVTEPDAIGAWRVWQND